MKKYVIKYIRSTFNSWYELEGRIIPYYELDKGFLPSLSDPRRKGMKLTEWLKRFPIATPEEYGENIINTELGDAYVSVGIEYYEYKETTKTPPAG